MPHGEAGARLGRRRLRVAERGARLARVAARRGELARSRHTSACVAGSAPAKAAWSHRASSRSASSRRPSRSQASATSSHTRWPSVVDAAAGPRARKIATAAGTASQSPRNAASRAVPRLVKKTLSGSAAVARAARAPSRCSSASAHSPRPAWKPLATACATGSSHCWLPSCATLIAMSAWASPSSHRPSRYSTSASDA